MVILPAIDLKGGVCVRLRQGVADDVTEYNRDPAEQARFWRNEGGKELHVVDLDGAFAGTPRHAEVIAAIIKAFGGIVEVGGGLRTMAAVESVLAAGAARAILGSAAIENPAFLAEALAKWGAKIAVGIDARNGYVQTRGWVETTGTLAVDFVKKVVQAGAKHVIYTDTATDGMLKGPNLPQMAAVCDAAGDGAWVTASGGISSVQDIRNLKALGKTNLRAAIVGKALYDGVVKLSDCMTV